MSARYDVNIIELRCPCCSQTMDAKAKKDTWLTKCLTCETFLVVEPELIMKPNNFKVSFHVIAVPKHKMPKLKAVANQ